MNTDLLQRFRDGVANERFTLTRLAKVSGIPLATLSDMAAEDWRPQIFDRLEKLERGLEAIEAEAGNQTEQQGREPTAA